MGGGVRPGMAVRTAFGTGRIEAVNGEVATVRLDRNRALVIQEPLSRIQLVGPERQASSSGLPRVEPRREPPPRPGQTPEPAGVVRNDATWALRQAIEALRFGVVPTQKLRELTVGFEDLKRWVLSRLPEAVQGHALASEISGPFGTGKSHVAAVVRNLAAARGYLTASVEVDGTGVSLSDPQGLLFALWATLEGSGLEESTPLIDVFSRALDGGAEVRDLGREEGNRPAQNLRAVQVVKRAGVLNGHAHELDAVLSSSREFTLPQVQGSLVRESGISKSEATLVAMVGRAVRERPFDFLQVLIAVSLLAKKGGWKGLVVTIDEFEVEGRLLGLRSREAVRTLLRLLATYFNRGAAEPRAPLSVFIATADHNDDPMLLDLREVLRRHHGASRRVDPLSMEDLRLLAGSLIQLYEQAYGVRIPSAQRHFRSVQESLASDGILTDSDRTRTFVKRLVHALDVEYGPPGV